MANNLYTSTGKPAAGAFGASAVPRAEFDSIEDGFEKLKRHYLTFSFADLNTAGGRYLPALELGVITRVWRVADANNATTATVITLTIDGVAVVMPTLQFASGYTAGDAVYVVPTDNHTITDRDNILRVITDGGGSSVMPGHVIVEIERA